MQLVLREVWNWLPAFKAVAESEHLPTAAKAMFVSASALSRSITLLEQHIGQPLFARDGRRLVLNVNGQRLLAAIRTAESALESGLVSERSERLFVSSTGVLTNAFVLPALLELKAAQPVFPVLSHHRASIANEMLKRGELDMAFYFEPMEAPGLVLTKLGEASNSIYCGKNHPLYGKRSLQGDFEFSIPEAGDQGRTIDNWPIELPRRAGLKTTLLSTQLAACASGQLLCVLPDVATRGQKLWRIQTPAIPPTPLYAAFREGALEQRLLKALVASVIKRVKKK